MDDLEILNTAQEDIDDMQSIVDMILNGWRLMKFV